MLRDWRQVLDNVGSKQEFVVDARSSGRFHGTEPEPRPGLPSGHIPGSINVPFTEVLQDGRCDACTIRGKSQQLWFSSSVCAGISSG